MYRNEFYCDLHLKRIRVVFSSSLTSSRDLYQSIIKKSPVCVFNVYSYGFEIFQKSCGKEIKATYTYPGEKKNHERTK